MLSDLQGVEHSKYLKTGQPNGKHRARVRLLEIKSLPTYVNM